MPFFWKQSILTRPFLIAIMVLQGDGDDFFVDGEHYRNATEEISPQGAPSSILDGCENSDKRFTSYRAKSTPCERTVLNLKTKSKYDKELPRQMYSYFVNTVTDCSCVPSFSKFARSIGVTLESLEGYRKHGEFDRAWRDCIEIRRDYLTDCALTRRYDPSFVKFLLGLELDTVSEGEEDKTLAVTVKVEN